LKHPTASIVFHDLICEVMFFYLTRWRSNSLSWLKASHYE